MVSRLNHLLPFLLVGIVVAACLSTFCSSPSVWSRTSEILDSSFDSTRMGTRRPLFGRIWLQSNGNEPVQLLAESRPNIRGNSPKALIPVDVTVFWLLGIFIVQLRLRHLRLRHLTFLTVLYTVLGTVQGTLVGTELIETVTAFAASDNEKIWAIAPASNEGLILVGEKVSQITGAADILVMRVDSSNNLNWQLTLGCPGAPNDYGYAVDNGPGGLYIVVGSTVLGCVTSGGLTVPYIGKVTDGNTGTKTGEYAVIPMGTQAYGVKILGDSNFIVVVGHEHASGVDKGFAFRMDIRDYSITWGQRVASVFEYDALTLSLTDGSVAAVGNYRGASVTCAFTRFSQTDGTILAHAILSASTATCEGIFALSDGKFILSGGFIEVASGARYGAIIKVNPDGSIVWQQTAGGVMEYYFTAGRELSNGNFVFSGYTSPLPDLNRDMIFYMTTNAGLKVTETVAGGSYEDTGNDIWVSMINSRMATAGFTTLSTSNKDAYLLVNSGCDDGRRMDVTGTACECNPGSAVVGNAGPCIGPNNGATLCLTLAVCADSDPTKAECSGTCTCKSGYGWSSTQNMCLSYNNGASICSTLSDCYIQDSALAGCNFGTCRCLTSYLWDQSSKKCLGKNNGIGLCTDIYDCVDQTSAAVCQAYIAYSVCECKSGYIWTGGLCAAPNDGSTTCGSLATCVDSNPTRAECVVVCKCKAPYVYSTAKTQCMLPNDGTSGCTTVSDCIDYSSNAVCSFTRCDCIADYIWVPEKLQCLIKVGTAVACSSISECSDQSAKAECDAVCQCKSGYLVDSSHGKCMSPNDGAHGCSTLADCYISSSTIAGCVSGQCICGAGYLWRSNQCLGINDGSGGCILTPQCVDSNPARAACSSGHCNCKANNRWHVLLEKCLGENAGLSTCAGDSECYDQNPSTSWCDGGTGKCACRSPYEWDSTLGQCLGPNDGNSACADLSWCQDQSANGVCNPFSLQCGCVSGTVWKGGRKRCLPANTGQLSCILLNDCADNNPAYAVCDSNHKCSCISGYMWTSQYDLCKIPNNNQFSCASIAECVDQTPGKGICAGKCTCAAGYLWTEGFGRCLLPNDGQNACSDIFDCVDQGINAICLGGKCACQFAFHWINDKAACLKYNDGTRVCSSLAECADQDTTRAVCVSTCNCAIGYSWSGSNQKCLVSNNGGLSCSGILDCVDQDPLSAICDGKCKCINGNVWSPTARKCECDQGKYSATGNGNCLLCPTGQYQDSLGQTTCLACPANTYSPNLGNIAVSDCYACPLRSTSALGADKCDCDLGSYYDSSVGLGSGSQYCPECHPFCTSCAVFSTNCASCKAAPGIYQVGNQCLCQVTSGFFLGKDAQGKDECVRCNRLCGTCYGASNAECDSCLALPNTTPFAFATCSCAEGYFDDPSSPDSNPCQLCAKYCVVCSGVATNCTSCEDNPGVALVGNSCVCNAPGYFEYHNPDNGGKEECVRCHPLCTTCDGPKNSQCTLCDSTKGAVYEPFKTCTCGSHHYYDPASEKCEPCNALCENCTGPTSDQCIGCNYALSALQVENIPGKCVTDCTTLDKKGYFLLSSECKECNDSCATCIGPGANQCLTCKDQTKVMYHGECLIQCPVHYFSSNRICYECHESCKECSDGSKSGCVSCPDNASVFLYGTTCVNPCPEGTFERNRTCSHCQAPCQNCLDEEKCLTCAHGYYMVTENGDCVERGKCPDGTYADEETGTCQKCFYTCLTCHGPSSKDCILCNFAKGFGKGAGDVGECYMIICPYGTFLRLDYDKNVAVCEPCHESCKTCYGVGSDNCTECNPGYKSFPSSIANRVFCKTCAEANPGYYTLPDANCGEICGDGRNLGQVQCDDGNRVNGDGCSADCEIEPGFECHPGPDGPDVCTDISPPSPFLKVRKGNVLWVEFNEPIVVSKSSAELLGTVEVKLEGTKEPCGVSFSWETHFAMNATLDTFLIKAKVGCSLRGQAEKFVVHFNDPSAITDLAGNVLGTSTVSCRAMRYVYVSDAEQAAIEGTGSAFSASSLLTLGLVIGMNMLQSAAVGSFWAFVNMVQLISYLPILQCEIPYNLEVFLTRYLTVSKVVLPFKMLPGWVPNPLEYFEVFITRPLGERFSLCGYDTFSFIYNFADELTTWILLLGIYIALRLLDWVLPKHRFEFIRKWKKDYEFNAVFRVLVECYLNLVFCSFLNIWIVLFVVRKGMWQNNSLTWMDQQRKPRLQLLLLVLYLFFAIIAKNSDSSSHVDLW